MDEKQILVSIDYLVDRLLDAGDMIFFNNSHIVTKFIAFMCNTPWSHVGLVIVLKDGRKCLLESIFHYIPMEDVFTHKVVTLGCRCVDLKDRLHLNKRIGVKKCFLPADQLKDAQDRLLLFAQQNSHKPYEKTLFTLLEAWYDGPGSILRPFGLWEEETKNNALTNNPMGMSDQVKDDNSGFFCTKLIAEAIFFSGISNRIIAYNYAKKRFEPVHSGEYIIGNLLSMNKGYQSYCHIYILHDGTPGE